MAARQQRRRMSAEQVELLREAAIQIRDVEKLTSPAAIARRIEQLHGVKVSRQRVHEWLQADPITPETVQEYRLDRRKALVDRLYQAAEAYIDHASRPEVIMRVNGKDAATAAAIFIDKALLASGEATQRVESRNDTTVRTEEGERAVNVLGQLSPDQRRAVLRVLGPAQPGRTAADTG